MASSGRPFTLCLDNAGVFYGLVVEAWRGWTAGRVPHWTDAFWGGFPLIGDSTTGALYLPHLVAYLTTAPPHLAFFNVAAALHLGLLAAGSVRLLALLGASRRAAVLGGVLAALSPFPHWVGLAFFPVLGAEAWWPWALSAAEALARPERPRFGAFVTGWIALAAQVVVGVPEQAVYAATATALWLLFRRTGLTLFRRIGRLALLGAGAIALAAPQLLPTTVYIQTTDRVDVPAGVQLASLLLTDPLALVVPGWGVLNGIPSFLGVATLALAAVAVLGRRPRPLLLATIALAGFLLALGGQTPLHGLWRRIPPFDHFRSPIKYHAFAELGAVWLAAIGADHLWRRATAAARAAAAALAVAAVLEHLVYVAQEVPALVALCTERDEAAAVVRTLGRSVLARPGAPGAPRPLVLDLYAGGVNAWARNLTAAHGINSLTGGRPALLSRRHNALLIFRVPTRPQLDLLGARYVIIRRERCPPIGERLGLVPVEDGAEVCILENPTARPRYELLGAVEPVDSETALIVAVRRYAGGPTPVLGPPADLADAAGGRVNLRDYAPGAVRLDVEAPRPALLLARHTWVPGWEARVDGAPTETYQAAGIFFAVAVPAGRHTVTLRYRTPRFVPGLAVAAAWIVGAAGAYRMTHRRRRRRGPSP
jgi:hypothetical protein